MTILPDHEPMLLPFRIGLIQAINAHGERYFYFTQSGVGRITGNIVVLSTIECVPTKALSRTQIEKEIALSEKRSESVVERSEKETLHNDLQILQAKLEIIKRLQSHHST